MKFKYFPVFSSLPDIKQQLVPVWEEQKQEGTSLRSTVRLQSLEIDNFKGVKHGSIELYPIGKKQDGAKRSNILALYGQNGSGKTSVIQVLYLLKHAMMGSSLPDDAGRMISQGAETAQIKAVFEYRREGEDIVEYITYSFSLQPMHYEDENQTETVGICDEVLSLCKRDLDGKLIEKTRKLFDTKSNNKVLNTSVIEVEVQDFYNPDKKWKERFQIDGDWLMFFPRTRQDVINCGGSLLFGQLLESIEDVSFGEADEAHAVYPNRYAYIGLLKSYASNYLFIAGANLFNGFSNDKSPLYLRHGYYEIHQEDKVSFRQAVILARCLVPLNRVLSAVIPGLKVGMKATYSSEKWIKLLDLAGQIDPDALTGGDMVEQYSEAMDFISEGKKLFSESNDFIESIIDGAETSEETFEEFLKGLSDSDEESNPFVDDNSPTDFQVEFFTKRGETVTPLMDESEGIRHIIYDLDLFVAAYNDPSMTVAIDEFDAGVFEYLLGEMLKIFERHGKGQLIFTSHNLRPLEVLDRSFVCFTTTNPENRYLRMKYINQTNNLRDVYYRQILVGEQDEDLYDYVDSFELKDALDRAGEE